MEMIDHFATLDEFGLPHICIYESGRIFDTILGIERFPQINGQFEMLNKDTNKRFRCAFSQLYGFYFRSPWRQNVVIPYRSLEIIGYPRYYAVCDGRIFSTYNYDYLCVTKSFDGYSRVTIMNNSNSQTINIHRLIAIAFIPNPENKPEVNHIDGNKDNNHVTNLEWVYCFENVDHARKHGLRKASLTDIQIHEICRLLQDGYRNIDIANMMNIDTHHVKSIKSGCHSRISDMYRFKRNKHF